MICRLVRLDCENGIRHHFLQAVADKQIVQHCRCLAGNLQYEFFLSDKSCNSVLLVEKWSSEEHLKAYLASECHKVLESLFPCAVISVKVGQYSV